MSVFTNQCAVLRLNMHITTNRHTNVERNPILLYSLFQKDLQSGLGLKKYEDKGNLDNKVHRMAC